VRGFHPFDGFIDADTAAAVRERVRPGLEPYDVPDRGRYLVATTHVEPELFARLEALAAERLGAAVARVAARWTRLVRGDYALYKDDARRRAGDAEVCLDLSAAASGEAQIVYRAEDETAAVAQRPGAGAVVERRRPVYRYDRYLGVRYGDGEVFRLTLGLRVV
jgi:hypothetical protein